METNKPQKAAKFFVSVWAACLLLFCTGPGVSAVSAPAQKAFVFPDETKPQPVNFVNGSFQTPEIPWNEKNVIVQADSVPGWDTMPTHGYDKYDPDAYMIEIQRVTRNYSGFATEESDGDQYAELEANVPGRLYQNIRTVPGSRLYWSFEHRARAHGNNSSGYRKDSLNFSMRSAGTPDVSPKQNEIICDASSDGKSWHSYSGEYVVPEGQTDTELAFAAVSSSTGSGSEGNFLDSISLRTGSFLVAKKSISVSSADGTTALQGEAVTITVAVTNWGETDASRCVLRDSLSDGLEYIEGSARINGDAAGRLAYFDRNTGELRINFGQGASEGDGSTNGGLLKGSIRMGAVQEGETASITFQAKVTGEVGRTVKNQASVSYNDRNFENYNAEGFTCYSSVGGKVPAENDESTYVNRFTVTALHSLTLSKRVMGELADPQKEFTFTVVLNGVQKALLYTGATTVPGVPAPENGVVSSGGTVTLRHGQSITIAGIPVSTGYSIAESNSKGYVGTVTGKNASGVLTEDVSVEFVNTKKEVVPTGVVLEIFPYVFIVVLAVGVAAVLFFTRRKR